MLWSKRGHLCKDPVTPVTQMTHGLPLVVTMTDHPAHHPIIAAPQICPARCEAIVIIAISQEYAHCMSSRVMQDVSVTIGKGAHKDSLLPKTPMTPLLR